MVALLVAGSAAAAVGAPVIHEPFTLLPCPKDPKTTVAIEGCEEQAIVWSDRQIDARAKRIFDLLAPSARPGFVRGELTWLAYRRAVCTADASKYAGGTEAPVEFASCEVLRNKTHLADLADVLRTLRGH